MDQRLRMLSESHVPFEFSDRPSALRSEQGQGSAAAGPLPESRMGFNPVTGTVAGQSFRARWKKVGRGRVRAIDTRGV
jgi:hypothetical protein